MDETKKVTRWPRLLLGAFALLFAGIIYAWTNIKAPFGEGGFGWNNSQLGLNYTITMCMFCLGGLFSGLLNKKIKASIRMIFSAVLIFTGMFITSRLDGNSPALLYIGYGFMMGLGVGIVYNIVISLTNAWFPDKKGLCSGVLMMAFGFSALLLGKLAGYLFTTSLNWNGTYLILGLAIAVVILIVGLLIRAPRPEEAATFAKAKAKVAKGEQQDFTPTQMLKRASFWKLFLFFVLFSAVGGIALAFGKDVMTSVGLEKETAADIAGYLALFNGAGRICSGAVFDAMGTRKTQFVTSGVVIAAGGITALGIALSQPVMAVIGVCLCGFSYGFSPTVSAALAGQFYGLKNFPTNFSLLNLVLIPSAFYATIAGKIVDATGGFLIVFVILTVFSLIGLVDNILIKRP